MAQVARAAQPARAVQAETFDAAMERGRAALGRGDAGAAIVAFGRALELQPASAPALTLLGVARLQSGDAAAALQSLNAAVEASPADLGARRWRAQALLAVGRPSDAVEDAREAVRLAPEEFSGLALLGRIQLVLGEFQQALDVLSDADGLRPNDTGVLYGRSVALVDDAPDSFVGWALFAAVLRQREDIDSLITAAEAYARALELRPTDLAAAHASASLYGELGLYARGSAVIVGAGAAGADSPAMQLLLGRLLAQAGNFDAAVPAYRRAIELGADAEVWRNLAVAYVALADPAAAIDAFTRAIAIDSLDGEAHLGLGEQLLAANRVDEAIDNLTQAALLLANSSRAQHQMARALQRMGDAAGAAATLRYALDLDPDNGSALNDLAAVLDEFGDTLAAAEARAEIAACQPPTATAEVGGDTAQLVRDGYVQLRLGDAAESVRLLRMAVELEPGNEAARFFLGRALASTGETQEGILSLEAAQQLNPHRAETYAALAELYAQVGRTADAQRAREEAARLRR